MNYANIGGIDMTTNEKILINMIHNSGDTDKALMTAIDIISAYLKQHGSSEGQAPADPLAHA